MRRCLFRYLFCLPVLEPAAWRLLQRQLRGLVAVVAVAAAVATAGATEPAAAVAAVACCCPLARPSRAAGTLSWKKQLEKEKNINLEKMREKVRESRKSLFFATSFLTCVVVTLGK